MSNKPKLKILTVGPLPPPVGGMATVVQNLSAALDPECEHRVYNTVKTTPTDRTLIEALSAQGKMLWQYFRLLFGWKPDVVHIHTCSFFTFWYNSAYVILTRLAGRRVVLHIHGAMFHKFLAGLPFYKAWYARWVFRRCYRVIVLGQDWKAILSEWTDIDRIAILPNTVPVPALIERSETKILTVLCMANYEQRKGQRDLIQALAACKTSNLNLLLLGFEAESGERQNLLNIAESVGVEDRVSIPGPIDSTEKDKYYMNADIFCLPSYDEGLPMSMLEAMAASLPVLVTPVGAIPEVIENGKNGLICPPGDITAMSNKLDYLAGNHEIRLALGEAARQLVVDQYSMPVSVKSLMNIYRNK